MIRAYAPLDDSPHRGRLLARTNNADRALCNAPLHSRLHSIRQLEIPVRGTCHPQCSVGEGLTLGNRIASFWVEPL